MVNSGANDRARRATVEGVSFGVGEWAMFSARPCPRSVPSADAWLRYDALQKKKTE
jgi:hypothetical protein